MRPAPEEPMYMHSSGGMLHDRVVSHSPSQTNFTGAPLMITAGTPSSPSPITNSAAETRLSATAFPRHQEGASRRGPSTAPPRPPRGGCRRRRGRPDAAEAEGVGPAVADDDPESSSRHASSILPPQCGGGAHLGSFGNKATWPGER